MRELRRNLPHLLLENPKGKAKPYKSRQGGSSEAPTPYLDRVAHADVLLEALSKLPDINKENLPGVYLRVEGRPHELMITDSLGKSGLTLLRVKEASEVHDFKQAIVFASSNGIYQLRKKIRNYRSSAHKNTSLVDSISTLAQAKLQDLWKSKRPLPNDNRDAIWEIWVRRELLQDFFTAVRRLSFPLTKDYLNFPDDAVFMGKGNHSSLYNLIVQSGAVRWLAPVATPTFFLDNLSPIEQREWSDDLLKRLEFRNGNTGYAAILDYGIGLSNPLIRSALNSTDRYTAEPSWGVTTNKGHGTAMAGLAVYGDLLDPLQGNTKIIINHKLESVKILPEIGNNPHYFLGKVTINGIHAAEIHDPSRRRTFIMAVTTPDDTPHDGAPTAWSAVMDQCAAGTEQRYIPSEDKREKQPRLILVSAGNVDWNKHNTRPRPYLDVCDEEEIESPAQAWNVITVGAYTTKTRSNAYDVAKTGDLQPTSRTASWDTYWPIKPDIVMEGGNYTNDQGWPPCPHEDMALLTLNHNYPKESLLRSFFDTSAATAVAGKEITELWTEYPNFWPETIRGLFIASARWTDQMEQHWRQAGENKTAWKKLSKRYGYGVPNLKRAKWSAKNALTMIIQDKIAPYGDRYENKSYKHNNFKLYKLPWPESALRAIGAEKIQVRIALSYFIDPNPSQPETGNKYTYASHNLRFDLQRTDEDQEQFVRRVGNDTERDNNQDGTPDWQFGTQQRNVGSIQIDLIKGHASDFIQRGCLAIYPAAGWWKTTKAEEQRESRFSVIIEIDAENANDADIYTEVKNQISVPITV